MNAALAEGCISALQMNAPCSPPPALDGFMWSSGVDVESFSVLKAAALQPLTLYYAPEISVIFCLPRLAGHKIITEYTVRNKML